LLRFQVELPLPRRPWGLRVRMAVMMTVTGQALLALMLLNRS
jgi:hypothetical protein